jgi:uncharacterized coiled-coil protein SlyX
MTAVSGKAAFKEDGGDWATGDMPVGGFEDIAHGGGFLVATGNNIAAVSPERALAFKTANAPDYIYTSVVYGAGRFWLLGSAVVAAYVVNVSEALENANGANGSNPFATMTDLAASADETREIVGESIESFKTETTEAMESFKTETTETVESFKTETTESIDELRSAIAALLMTIDTMQAAIDAMAETIGDLNEGVDGGVENE